MEMKRHAAYGRLSELFGSAALDFDIGMRKFNLLAGARKDLAALSKRELAVLQNHADGINYFATTKWLPIEFSIMGVKFSEWTPLDFAPGHFDDTYHDCIVPVQPVDGELSPEKKKCGCSIM